MDGRYAGGGGGGGCIARYGVGGGIERYTGGGCGSYDMSMVDRMMLQFRPIAPKPMASGSGPGGSTTQNSAKSGRGKRRYVRVKGNKKNKDTMKYGCSTSTVAKKRKVSTSSTSPPREAVSGGGDGVVTLSLMPETPDRKEELSVICSQSENLDIVPTIMANDTSAPIWLSFKNKQTVCDGHVRREAGHVDSVSGHAVDMMPPPPPPQRQQVVSFVTVECVTETWVDGEGIDCTDEDRVNSMERDTCPGFISDGGDRVVWTNKAYREMAGGEEVVVLLVRKEGNWPMVSYPAAITCKVRVTFRSGMSSSTLTVPCDVWRMEGVGGGGYAWRLDVKAALCLGR